LRIRQVLTNLVSNAIRYSPAATRVCVRLTLEPASAIAARHAAYAAMHPEPAAHTTLVLISVEDQGAGISDEQLGRLFKRYARGRERRGEGLGLGLYLSREFVARHGGDIWAESREGSTFYFTLPLESEHTNGLDNI
jgi:two-component system phosphate regulon sensor histidine kinase PhoR